MTIRQIFIATVACTAFSVGLNTCMWMTPRAKAQTTPIAHLELKRLWQACERADSAREVMDHAPPSWGPLPWEFTGVTSAAMEERYGMAQQTVVIRVHGIRDVTANGMRLVSVDYEVRRPVHLARTWTRNFHKGPAR